MILIRNCPHNNGIYTLIHSNNRVITKSSYSIDGINSLGNEYKGYKWYLNRIHSNYEVNLKYYGGEKKTYCRLVIPMFPGQTGECYKSISYNKKLLYKAVDAYVKFWPTGKNKKVSMHGDYSLGNMIFNEYEDLPNIIDWEHFTEDIVPWGFDIVNLLYESVFFSFRGKNYLGGKDLAAYIDVKEYLQNILNKEGRMKCDLHEITNIISSNISCWGNLVKKLPVMHFSVEQSNYINQIDCKNIN